MNFEKYREILGEQPNREDYQRYTVTILGKVIIDNKLKKDLTDVELDIIDCKEYFCNVLIEEDKEYFEEMNKYVESYEKVLHAFASDFCLETKMEYSLNMYDFVFEIAAHIYNRNKQLDFKTLYDYLIELLKLVGVIK